MSEETKAQTEAERVAYWDSLNQKFQAMQSTIGSELEKMQKVLEGRSRDMNERLDALSKMNDIFHGNLDKQLNFHSKLDKIMQESQDRQMAQSEKMQATIDRITGKRKEPEFEKAQAADENYSINLD